MLRLPRCIGHAVALFEITAGAKGFFTRTGYYHNAGVFRLERQTLKQIDQIPRHLRVERVGHLWPVQPNQQDMRINRCKLQSFK